MTRPSFTRRLDASCILGFALAIVSAAHGYAAEPLHTNHPKFRIPFQFDAEEMAQLRAVEIQLYVSTNQGRDWEHAQSVPTSETRFTFEAKEDAEYWFAVSTLDVRNQRHPGGPLQPGLRVVVDRTAPEFEVGLQESAAGEVTLNWHGDDEHLKVDSLDLEFLDPNTAEWQPVAITPSAAGRTSWSVPRTGRVLVRGSINDLAGNTTSAEAVVVLGGVSDAAPSPPTPDFSQPVAESPVDEELAGAPEPSTVRSSLPPSEQPLIRPIPLDDEETPQIVGAPQPPTESVPAPHPFSAPADPDPISQTEPDPIPQATTRIPRVNSTQFYLNYQLDGVGPSGVRDVKLYITEDDGEKWFVYGSDEDRQSPFTVEVPEDGQYGFALRVQSGAGVEADPPQPGQSPDMSLVVDRRPPRIELLPLKKDTTTTDVQVRIRWRIDDEQLAEEPVALSYASRADGPWEPIFGWSEDTGEYVWTIGDGMPANLYVRLEARDAAGNVASADSSTPLVMDVTRPTARIVDVESIEQNESPR